MSMTAKNVPYKEGFGPFAPEVYRVPSPYPYRWPSGADRAGDEALAALKEAVLTQIGADNVAAIVAEPIQGEGGFIVPPPGYLKAVQEFAREHGIVLVADEIQTGLARTGAMFACEHDGVVPDLVTTAKALAGGMPLAAVTGRAELMDAVPAGGLGGTYAGNPVACAAALAALEVIERDGLVQRAQEIEDRVMPRLQALAGPDSVVGEVRGRGAMLAIELVRPGTTEPAPEVARAVAAHCHREGVLTLVCGTFGNVIRLLPPLVIPFDVLDDAVGVLEEAVRSAR
jgi:4-aminobutyrate aminotransferase/(S)-3-amino-2-methylpropionate transaminase